MLRRGLQWLDDQLLAVVQIDGRADAQIPPEVFDRFARTTAHLVSALAEFNTLGVAFVSLQEQIDTSTPLGKAMFAIIGALAELERDLHCERIKAGMARAKAAGRTVGRKRIEADVSAARQLLDGGHSQAEVARLLNLSCGTLRRRLAEAADPG